MFCTKCGANIQNDAKYCPYCGSPIEYTQQNQNYQSQTQYQQPNYQNYQNYQNGYYGHQNYPYQPSVVPGKGSGIASFILGICAILFYDAPVIGLILGILGIVFGKSSLNGAKSVGQSNGLAIAGIVCSSIVVGFYVIVVAWALLILGVIF